MPAKVKQDKKIRKYRKSQTNTSRTQRSPSYSPDDDASFSDSEESRYHDEENHEAYSQEHSPPQEDYASDDYSYSDEEYKQKIQLRWMRDHLNRWEQQRKRHPRKNRNRRSKPNRECNRNRRKLKRSRVSSKTKHKPRKAPPDESPSTPSVHRDSQTAEPLPDLEVPSPTALTTTPPPTAWTLLARLPAGHPDLGSYIIGRLNQHPQVTEIIKEETTGEPQPQITIRIKGSEQALYDTQAELAKGGYYDVIWQEDPLSPSSASSPNYRQTTHWETPRTYSPHSETLDSSKKAKSARENAKPDGLPSRNGVIKTIMEKGKYGWIETVTDDAIFVLPSGCTGFPDPLRDGRNIIPPVGTKVIFEMGTDAKTGKDKAILVGLDQTERSATQRKHHSKPNPIGA